MSFPTGKTAHLVPSLNPQQQDAVTETDKPLLVVAGAGSGKTRVITEKIAHLVRQGLSARHIAAVTFTNKAAREMKSRVGRLLEDREVRGLTVSTFHALGLDIIRREHKALGYKKTVSIFDEQDRLTLLRELIRHHRTDIDPDHSESFSSAISRLKNLFILPGIEQSSGLNMPGLEAIYSLYLNQMRAYNAVDFDDLILQPVLLFRDHPEILEKWQNKLRYLLVDEYQDTNETQYQMLKLLVGKLGRFTVVGDDDQSVYSWRGAQPENLAKLQKDFPQIKVIKLEQNYRSTSRILDSANALIANNPHVIEKRLWSALGQGDPLTVLHHKDDVHESRQVCSDLVHHRFRQASSYSDYAILYRSNHQARIFETALREASIPYFISGGQSFFGYSEIKDVLGYLRLVVNPDDDAAFLRVVNVPKREIGPATLEKLGSYAHRRSISLFKASQELGAASELGESAYRRLGRFVQLIQELERKTQGEDPLSSIEGFLLEIDYEGWVHENATTPESARRKIARIAELVEWLRRIGKGEELESPLPLDAVIAKIMLMDVLDRNQEEASGDRVNLMTLHASKGLEFPYVYLVGMEENLLPHENSMEGDSIEEERRLAYVGITRAQRRLTLSYCTHRKRRGEIESREPSRFLEELPEEHLEWAARKAVDPEILKERGQASLNHLRNLLKTP
jgi:ATP-dependent DNA helicase Rep